MITSLSTGRRTAEFAVALRWQNATVLVHVEEDLDFYSAADAKKLLLDVLEHQPRRIIVDVSDVFVDSSGIGVLVHIAQRVRLERGAFELTCSEPLGELMRVHGLHTLLGTNARHDPQRADRRSAAARRQLKTAA